MRGYTKEQIEAKGAILANYVLCSNCSLYWHKRVFEKHLLPSSTERALAIGHPVWDDLLDFAVPFEFTIPAGPRWAKRTAAKDSSKAVVAGAARGDGAAAAVEGVARRALKDHHAALLERRTRLEEEIAQAERDLGVAGTTARAGAPGRGVRTPDHPLAPGMTAWVNVEEVVCAVGCSKSKAHEYLRAAARRLVGTGRLLRVPLDVWEAWARENLFDGMRGERRGVGRESPDRSSAGLATSKKQRRRRFAPFPPVESKLPLIPPLTPRKK